MCGRTVPDPVGKPETRLVCAKCHTPFYVNTSGRAIIGEPPAVDEYEKVKRQVREKAAQVPVKKIVLGVAAVVVAWLGLSYLFRPAERLDRAAEAAGRAFVGDDLAALKSLAAPDTDADLALWFAEVHPRLMRARERWHGVEEVVEVHVAKEDRKESKGVAGVSIHPGGAGPGIGDTLGLANPAEATASAPPQAVDLDTEWTLDKWGHWRLDGRETLAKVRGGR
jgi:hypothetical protein